MKYFIGLVVVLALGMGALVMTHESKTTPLTLPDENVAVKTISNGEAVDLLQHVPSSGYTIIEFTADF